MTKLRCGEIFVTGRPFNYKGLSAYSLWVVDSHDKYGRPRVRNLETKAIHKNFRPYSPGKQSIYVGEGLRHW